MYNKYAYINQIFVLYFTQEKKSCTNENKYLEIIMLSI